MNNYRIVFSPRAQQRLVEVARKAVMPAGKRASRARDSEFNYFPVAWIPAIHAGMTISDLAVIQSNKELSLYRENRP